ncbi:hypothetical protein EGW08_015721 [Elysia chlorotica]|uniref:15-oxoprostaglandin 13-reductase n=1 Tax=Elysia chlorotica TaxID=188477 RepID=A0A3S1BWA5_ELYCH|nr:hypothetical protein EGW08_015721 [Elysia chlorotica]
MSGTIPLKMKQVQVVKPINDFRKATKIVEVSVPTPGARNVLVKMRYLMLNASDLLFVAGTFCPLKPTPYAAGIEGLGEIVKTGTSSVHKVGQAVAVQHYHCFSEYAVVPDDSVIPIPSCDNPEFGALYVCGSTAYGVFDKKYKLKKTDVVIVTAAAGATGHIAVQLAKEAGCHVIGTCSSEEKVNFLKSIGCDRPINCNTESVDSVLKKEYPRGFDVAFECVGNKMPDICLQNVASLGRIICVGSVDVYGKKNHIMNQTCSLPISMTLTMKSADLLTLFMPNFKEDIPAYFKKLTDLMESGKLKIAIDKGEKAVNGPFRGIEKVFDAMDYLFSRKSIGKICVEL